MHSACASPWAAVHPSGTARSPFCAIGTMNGALAGIVATKSKAVSTRAEA